MGATKSGTQHGSTTVLLAEDNADVRAFVSRVLRGLGYIVIEAANGTQALESTGDSQVDVLISDVMMPEMGGTELARRFQLARPGVPVLLMSGYTPEPIPKGLDITFLPKPFSIDQLLAALDRTTSGQRTLYWPATTTCSPSSVDCN